MSLRSKSRYEQRLLRRQFFALGTTRATSGLRYTPRIARIECPPHLSLVEAPEDTLSFLQKVTDMAQRAERVEVAMESVQNASPDGVLALLIAIVMCPGKLFGNLPVADAPRQMMLDSGLQEHVRHAWAPRAGSGWMERSGKIADGKVAARLVTFAATKLGIPPKSDRYSYKMLLECMANTRNHASGPRSTKKRKRWCAQVFYDTRRGVACFCFADLGLGIIKTLKLDANKRIRALVRSLISGTGEVSVLREVLDSRIKSSTRQPNRGLGLPKIASLCATGYLQRLVIVANHAHMDYGRNAQDTRQEFSGTLLYWEVARKPQPAANVPVAERTSV